MSNDERQTTEHIAGELRKVADLLQTNAKRWGTGYEAAICDAAADRLDNGKAQPPTCAGCIRRPNRDNDERCANCSREAILPDYYEKEDEKGENK